MLSLPTPLTDLTYNRKEKVNEDAYYYTNELLLTYSTSADGSSTSWIARALSPGQKEYVTLVEGSMILEIIACHRYYGTPGKHREHSFVCFNVHIMICTATLTLILLSLS